MRRANWFAPLLRQRWIQAIAKRGIDARVAAARPDAARQQSQLRLGRSAQRGRETQNRTTAHGERLLADRRVLARYPERCSQPRMPGFTTPSTLVGADFVTTLPGSSPIRIDS